MLQQKHQYLQFAKVALAEPSNEAEPVASPEIAKVLAVYQTIAVAAFPEVSWLPVWFTPR